MQERKNWRTRTSVCLSMERGVPNSLERGGVPNSSEQGVPNNLEGRVPNNLERGAPDVFRTRLEHKWKANALLGYF